MSRRCTAAETRPRCTSSSLVDDEDQPATKRAKVTPSSVITTGRRVTRAMSAARPRRTAQKPRSSIVKRSTTASKLDASSQAPISAAASSSSSATPSSWVVIPTKNPIKLQALVDFLTPAECAHLIALGGKQGFLQSPVLGGDGMVTVAQWRTSTSSILTHIQDDTLQAVRERMAALTNFPIAHQVMSLVRYEKGQEVRAHFDSILGLISRRYTVLCYLNAVEGGGGATSFPLLGVTAQPKEGAALFWENQPNRDRAHPESMHAGLPVVSGLKVSVDLR